MKISNNKQFDVSNFSPHLQSNYSSANLAKGGQESACSLFPNTLDTKRPLSLRAKPNGDQSASAPLKQRDGIDKAQPYKKIIKGLVGHPFSSATLIHYSSKEIVYSFNKANNLYPLITKIEKLLKSLFLSMYSLISRPVYLIKHDKVIIRLFVFLSPKAEKFLDTTSYVKDDKLRGPSSTIFSTERSPIRDAEDLKTVGSYPSGTNGRKKKTIPGEIKKYLKYKSYRPKIVEILNSQINIVALRWLRKPNLLASQLDLATQPFPGSRITEHALPLRETHSFFAHHATEVNGVTYENVPYTSLLSNFRKTLEKLSGIFSKIFKKKIEFEIIKAQIPYQDPNLIAQILGYNANEYNFRRMLKIIIPRAVIKNPSKEIVPPSTQPYPMLASLNLLSSSTANITAGVTLDPVNRNIAARDAERLGVTKVNPAQRLLKIISPWAG